MSRKLENVKVGDKLIVHTYFCESIEVVERTTATLIITKFHRFNKKSGQSLGSSKWNCVWASVGSDEEIEKIQQEAYRRNLISKCKSIESNNLSDFQLEAIIKIANNHG